MNIARKFIHWSNGRQMNKYIGKELDKRYREFRDDPNESRKKAVIDLVLQTYVSVNTKGMSEKLDLKFRAFAISQIRLFIFLDYASTSSTICYIIHLLATNPHALARLRAEHDEIFGENLSTVPAMLQDRPHLTNSLSYITAVIKEALRLFPSASCTRQRNSQTDIIDDQDHSCSTNDVVV
jgi:cytochrome P450